ncbi:hypothetical protein LPJ78_000368 [Coemansia sp. RSA 989]|nr:hypothetical protein LPJ68_000799 [Coemansia sp. RSA 1086]KAJ1868239.1 hypothetical protein LPJ78_000368 [Coemansia sp. RSA 989]KAJ1874756.1 hypothetical protein LPJ55_001229 [Coemansia sp. RSA 990]
MLLTSSMGNPYESSIYKHPDNAFSTLMNGHSHLSSSGFSSSRDNMHSDFGSQNIDSANLFDVASIGQPNYGIPNSSSNNCPSGFYGGPAQDSMQGSEERTLTPENGDSSSRKRHRLTPEQTRKLLEVFEKTTKPDSEMRKALGKQLGMTSRTVQIWFQNRRAKMKRESGGTGPVRSSNRFAGGTPSDRNRLTFNAAYLNRRQPNRVVSENIDHLRHSHAFTPFSPDGFYGLPLQNPSHVSMPFDMAMNLPYGQQDSAMGIPAGQRNRDGGFPDCFDGGMGQALSSVLPMNAHGNEMFSESGHVHNEEPFGFSNSHAMPPHNGMPPAMMPSYNPQAELDGRNGRMRSFTTDSHTLLNFLPQNGDAGVSGAPGEHLLPGYDQPKPVPPGHLPTLPPLPTMSSDAPSADILQQTRQRHLQDLYIINETHASRKLKKSEMFLGIDAVNSSKSVSEDGFLALPSSGQQQSVSVALAPAPECAVSGADTAVSVCESAPPLASAHNSPNAQDPAQPAQDNEENAAPFATSQETEANADQTVDQPEDQQLPSSSLHDKEQSLELPGNNSADQFQTLHDILKQYNMSFIGKGDSLLSDNSLLMSLTGSKSEQAADSLHTKAIPSGQCTSAGSDSSKEADDLVSELLAGNGMYESQADNASDNPPAFSMDSSENSKADSKNVVSVASSETIGQREVMIETMPFTMQF